MINVGVASSEAVWLAEDSGEAARIGYPDGEDTRARMMGLAFGHAFLAAEIAYDLGQRHAAERAARMRLVPRVLSTEEVEADRAAARERQLRYDRDAARKEALRLACDTRD